MMCFDTNYKRFAALEPTEAIKKIYEPDFRLKYTVKVRRQSRASNPSLSY